MSTKKTSGVTVSYAETTAIEAFLGYLNHHYSKLVNPTDKYLVSAVAAWFHSESGGIGNVIGNNPFNIRPGMTSFMSNGYRVSKNGNGKFLTFATLSKGFEATAYLLIHGAATYGYQLAISALKHSGNQAAYDFLAALAMSSWDGAHYGTTDWLSAYDPTKNHLLRAYTAITGVQLVNPHPKPKKPAKAAPQLPRDFNYHVVVRQYTNPWAARDRYNYRHGREAVTVDGVRLRR